MKLAHISSAYSWFLAQVFRSKAASFQESYDDGRARLFSRHFGWSDVWAASLGPLGYEVDEIVLNSPQLQQRWAREHGVGYDPADWRCEIVCAQVKQFQPDVIFLDDYAAFSAQQLRRIQESSPGLRLMVGWCGAPYASLEPFREFDLVLSNIPTLSRELNDGGVRSRVLRHAFDARVQVNLPAPAATECQITFCGTISTKSDWHAERTGFLENLTSAVPMSVASELYRRVGPLSRSLARIARGRMTPDSLRCQIDRLFERRGMNHPTSLVAALVPPVAGLKMYEFLASSTATFNKHIAKSVGESSNMRLFEAAGIGACLLTDHTADLGGLFELDHEVVSYSCMDECEEKARWLVGHPREARQIGLNARQRVLREHTFEHRATEFDSILQDALCYRR